jgi:hypothetical protein
MPSVSGAISQPSGLPISTIACLTHNELWHNPEFMKHVNLVSLLQELLKLQEKSVPSNFCCESPSIALSSAHCFLSAKPLSTSSSLALSQSASQVSSLIQAGTFMSFPCKAKHPDEFPASILWTWEDCKTDDSVGVSSSNVSRPPMQHAICHEDGFMLSRQSGRQFVILQRLSFAPTWIPSPLLPKPGPTSHARRCTSSVIFRQSGLKLFASSNPWPPCCPFALGNIRPT